VKTQSYLIIELASHLHTRRPQIQKHFALNSGFNFIWIVSLH